VRRLSVLTLSLALAGSAAPARAAAVPKAKPTSTHRCADGTTARAWVNFVVDPDELGDLTRIAVDNPCKKQWVSVRFPGTSVSDPYGSFVFVAPRQKINWEGRVLAEWFGWGWKQVEFGGTGLVEPKQACVKNFETDIGSSSYQGLVALSDKDIRNAPECGDPVPKLPASRSARALCLGNSGPYGPASRLSWKVDGKRLVKLEVANDCSANWTIVWWELDNGRKVAVWVEPGDSTDLWMSELDGLPTKMEHTRVHLGFDRTLGVDADDFGGSNPKKRPFYYNFTASGDRVG
jgi:hypothetical protein